MTILLFAWIGAVFIALGVYEWRQDNDLGDLRDRVNDLEGGISSIGDDEAAFQPERATAGDLILTIVSTSGEDESIPGVIQAPGSLTLRVENAGAETALLPELEILASASDGLACQVHRDLTQSAGSVAPAQADEMRLLWDCEDLELMTINGAEFRPVK